jgi:hypothetical protein
MPIRERAPLSFLLGLRWQSANGARTRRRPLQWTRKRLQ